MRLLTGQDVLIRAVDQLAGRGPRGPRYADAVKVLRLRQLRPEVDGLAAQVGRWYRGEIGTPDDVALRALDALGGINWDALGEPQSPDEVLEAYELSQRRTALLGRVLDDLGESPSADPGTP